MTYNGLHITQAKQGPVPMSLIQFLNSLLLPTFAPS